MLTIRAICDGRGYSSRHLEHSDYYSEGERVVGRWQGHGAELLALEGRVEHSQFEALRQGLDPRTGEFLRQRHGADRMSADGAMQSQARALYDFTFSAPKSVSILAILGEDKRLRAAHENAVAEALRETERVASSRVRRNGADTDRTTGNLAIAVYLLVAMSEGANMAAPRGTMMPLIDGSERARAAAPGLLTGRQGCGADPDSGGRRGRN